VEELQRDPRRLLAIERFINDARPTLPEALEGLETLGSTKLGRPFYRQA
jgi:hypothetical protein